MLIIQGVCVPNVSHPLLRIKAWRKLLFKLQSLWIPRKKKSNPFRTENSIPQMTDIAGLTLFPSSDVSPNSFFRSAFNQNWDDESSVGAMSCNSSPWEVRQETTMINWVTSLWLLSDEYQLTLTLIPLLFKPKAPVSILKRGMRSLTPLSVPLPNALDKFPFLSFAGTLIGVHWA